MFTLLSNFEWGQVTLLQPSCESLSNFTGPKVVHASGPAVSGSEYGPRDGWFNYP